MCFWLKNLLRINWYFKILKFQESNRIRLNNKKNNRINLELINSLLWCHNTITQLCNKYTNINILHNSNQCIVFQIITLLSSLFLELWKTPHFDKPLQKVIYKKKKFNKKRQFIKRDNFIKFTIIYFIFVVVVCLIFWKSDSFVSNILFVLILLYRSMWPRCSCILLLGQN